MAGAGGRSPEIEVPANGGEGDWLHGPTLYSHYAREAARDEPGNAGEDASICMKTTGNSKIW